MQRSETQHVRLTGDFRSHACTPNQEFGPAGLAEFEMIGLDVVAIDLGLLRIRLEKGDQRVVGRNLSPIDHGGPDELFVDGPAVLVFRDIALGPLQPVEELWLQRLSEDILIELERASGVLDNLCSFDPGEFVEEPSAACVHQHRVPLHFHELQRHYLLVLAESAPGLLAKKPVHVLRPAVEDHADVFIARAPWIAEDLAGFLFEPWCDGGSKPIQRFAQWPAPLLVPVRVSSGITSTVPVPPLQAMGAAP